MVGDAKDKLIHSRVILQECLAIQFFYVHSRLRQIKGTDLSYFKKNKTATLCTNQHWCVEAGLDVVETRTVSRL